MVYVQVQQGAARNRKVLKLARRLEIEPTHALGLLVCLWLAALEQAEDGDLGDWDSEDFALACGFDDGAALAEALVSSGLLTPERQIANWDEHTGGGLDKRARERARWRKQKRKQRSQGGSEDADSANCPPNVHADSTRTVHPVHADMSTDGDGDGDGDGDQTRQIKPPGNSNHALLTKPAESHGPDGPRRHTETKNGPQTPKQPESLSEASESTDPPNPHPPQQTTPERPAQQTLGGSNAQTGPRAILDGALDSATKTALKADTGWMQTILDQHTQAVKAKRPQKVTKDKAKLFRRAIDDGYPPSELLMAAVGLSYSPHHMGTERGSKGAFKHVKYIFRDVEKYRDLFIERHNKKSRHGILAKTKGAGREITRRDWEELTEGERECWVRDLGEPSIVDEKTG